VFGEYQWTEQARELFRTLLAFAAIVPTAEVLRRLAAIHPALVDLSLRSWPAMKLAVGLLLPPDEYCFLDDDVFVLDSVTDAAAAFHTCDLVYAPDADYSEDYADLRELDARAEPLPTGNINTGLYWLRNSHDPSCIATRMLSAPPSRMPAWQWEQGIMAVEFARDAVCSLPEQRYFYPYFDGLPGGIRGYDYGQNPCGFTSVHFGGLAEKPSDADARMLAAQILNRGRRGA
jgi:hypothetical protein